MKRLSYVILSIVVLVCTLPLFAILWSTWFAGKHGCILNEAGYNPCIVNGTDWGQTLGAAFITGWLALVTIPLGLAALLVIGVMMGFATFKKRQNRKL